MKLSRKKELFLQMLEGLQDIEAWCNEELQRVSEESWEKESHMTGMSLIHRACHTIEGRLKQAVEIPQLSMQEVHKANRSKND